MIQSVTRALGLLERVDEAGPAGLGLTDLAAAAGLKLPTACNLLQTLVELGYVAQDAATRRYRLGAKAWGHGRDQRLAALLRDVATAPMQGLLDRLNETVQLTIYRNQHRHTLLSVESSHTLRAGTPAGCDANLYDTATGRMLLAQLDADALAAHVARWPAPADLDEVLETIRAQRWAVIEKRDGLHAQAAPIPAPGLVAAIGVYYPNARWDAAAETRLRLELIATADAIGEAFAARL